MSASRLVAACLALAALALAATAGAAITPKLGTYQGTVNGLPTSNGHNEGEGYFDLKLVGGKRRIVADAPFAQILAPSDFRCHQLNANLPVKRIAVTSGAFKWSGTAPIGDANRAKRQVVFKGHWTNATHLVGSTRVSGKGCDKTVRWRMKTPPPPFSP